MLECHFAEKLISLGVIYSDKFRMIIHAVAQLQLSYSSKFQLLFSG